MLRTAAATAGAGHETTAAVLTWTFHLIVDRPDVIDRMRQEVGWAGLGWAGLGWAGLGIWVDGWVD